MSNPFGIYPASYPALGPPGPSARDNAPVSAPTSPGDVAYRVQAVGSPPITGPAAPASRTYQTVFEYNFGGEQYRAYRRLDESKTPEETSRALSLARSPFKLDAQQVKGGR